MRPNLGYSKWLSQKVGKRGRKNSTLGFIPTNSRLVGQCSMSCPKFEYSKGDCKIFFLCETASRNAILKNYSGIVAQKVKEFLSPRSFHPMDARCQNCPTLQKDPLGTPGGRSKNLKPLKNILSLVSSELCRHRTEDCLWRAIGIICRIEQKKQTGH